MSKTNLPQVIIWASDWLASTGQAIVTRRVIENQTKFEWVNASYGKGGWRSVFLWIGAIRRLYHPLFSQRKKNQVIYLVCSRSIVGFLRDVPALIQSFFGFRIVIHVHGDDLDKLLQSTWIGIFARVLYDRCELIVPSIHLVKSLRKISLAPIHICENFVPMEINDRKRFLVPNQKGPLIVWNSNILATKGFFDLCAAIRLARAYIPDLRLIALGAPIGDREMSIGLVHEMLELLKTEAWFTHLGMVTPEEAFLWTELADLYVFPSRNDCQPLALVQAMCLGKSIISNDIPPLRATLGEYPAKFLNAPSPQELAIAIRETLLEGCQPEIKAAAAKARARFSPERFDHNMACILSGEEG